MRGCEEGTVKQGEPFPWAPDLDRCPWAVIPAEALVLAQWEERRRRIGLLPMGADRMADLPQWVVEALDVAAEGFEIAQGVAHARERARLEVALAQLGARGGGIGGA